MARIGRHVGAGLLTLSFATWAAAAQQSSPAPTVPGQAGSLPQNNAGQNPSPNATQPGQIAGVLEDPSGDVLTGAQVTLEAGQGIGGQTNSKVQTVASNTNGGFSFENVPPGPYVLTATAPGFISSTKKGTLHPGEFQLALTLTMTIAGATTDVRVTVPRREQAQAEVAAEEKQRVLGFVPNFLVTYDRHPVALYPKQKFNLAWRTAIDPVNFGIAALFAGVQQATNGFPGYGTGAEGYGKRLGADYADGFIGTVLSSGVFPVVFRQDPRYIYKGTGSFVSRASYAVAMTLVCKGDNGHWQTNYSNILGSFSAGAISNLYYPAGNRSGVGLTLENGVIALGEGAAFNLLEEFVIRKFTPHLPPRSAQPTP